MQICDQGYPLELTVEFMRILDKEIARVGTRQGAVVLHFKDPDYHPESGGYHPVEILIEFAYWGLGCPKIFLEVVTPL